MGLENMPSSYYTLTSMSDMSVQNMPVCQYLLLRACYKCYNYACLPACLPAYLLACLHTSMPSCLPICYYILTSMSDMRVQNMLVCPIPTVLLHAVATNMPACQNSPFPPPPFFERGKHACLTNSSPLPPLSRHAMSDLSVQNMPALPIVHPSPPSPAMPCLI